MTSENKIKELLSGSGKTLSAAESCTGGMISHLITTIPGSSGYYLGSVTSYAVAVKNKLLGVGLDTINNNGIVSSAVAESMAEGVRRLTGSTYSVATTGWADSQGDEREPAGTVWVAVSGPRGTESFRFQSDGTRKQKIGRFARFALKKLSVYISKDLKV